MHSNKREYLEGIENINMKFPMPDIDDFIDHIDYVVKLIGIDYVGISSDFGGEEELVDGLMLQRLNY